MQYAPPPKRAAKSHKRKQPAAAATNGRKSVKRGPTVTAAPSKMATTATANPKSKSAVSTPASRPVRGTRSRPAPPGSSSTHKSKTVGTRVSTRLRGKEEEEVWQPIPEEWLKEESTPDGAGVPDEDHSSKSKGKGKEVEAKEEPALKALDDISELTSLSDLSDIEEEAKEADEDEDSTPAPLPDFSSSSEEVWETVRGFILQFMSARLTIVLPCRFVSL
jgi:hypothetical protein